MCRVRSKAINRPVGVEIDEHIHSKNCVIIGDNLSVNLNPGMRPELTRSGLTYPFLDYRINFSKLFILSGSLV